MKDYDYWSRVIERMREVREERSPYCEHGCYRSLCPECSDLR